MPRGRRNYTVQTPGEVLPETDQADSLEIEADDVRTLSDMDVLAQIEALKAENAKLRAASGRVEMEGNSKFARTHSSEVDKSTISAPALCADGWLVP